MYQAKDIENPNCKYCGQSAESCTCKPVRLIMRSPNFDGCGILCGYQYKTIRIRLPYDTEMLTKDKSYDTTTWEIISGEFIQEELNG